jgi:prevent-host-death family protein
MAMGLPLRVDALDELRRAPASDVKKRGWRGVMRDVASQGKILITHHNDPEAVILSAHEYAAMVDAVRTAQAGDVDTLEALRREFDQRLAVLDAEGAGDALRRAVRKPVKLAGKVKAGTGY